MYLFSLKYTKKIKRRLLPKTFRDAVRLNLRVRERLRFWLLACLSISLSRLRKKFTLSIYELPKHKIFR